MKTKKPVYKKWWFWVIIVVVLSSLGKLQQNSIKSEPAIDAILFDTEAKKTIESIDNNNIIESLTTSILDEIVNVDVYLSDTTYWTTAANLDKKEFVKAVGDMMEIVALDCRNNNDTIGVNTTIYSAGGFELGKRNIFGSVTITE